MINVPKYYKEGYDAAVVGVAMSGVETPMGFTFCPYPNDSVQRWNFVGGAVAAYMGQDVALPGEFQ